MAIDESEVKEIAETNANWVAVIPYGYTLPGQSRVVYDSEFQWWGERYDGAAELIRLAKAQGMQVMLKPQVWTPQMWVGDFYPENMKEWEESMTEFTIDFARLADSLEVELFCLATEYKRLAIEHPNYFEELIHQVRAVYSGKLTYAANWDEYNLVTFWHLLDYIGVNAYFPLSEGAETSDEALNRSWDSVGGRLSSWSAQHGKQILFTEFGYRSVPNTTERPWEHDEGSYDPHAQSLAFEALFRNVWNEPWLAGGFVWKWRFFDEVGGPGDTGFTPQGKPSLKRIQAVFAQ